MINGLPGLAVGVQGDPIPRRLYAVHARDVGANEHQMPQNRLIFRLRVREVRDMFLGNN